MQWSAAEDASALLNAGATNPRGSPLKGAAVSQKERALEQANKENLALREAAAAAQQQELEEAAKEMPEAAKEAAAEQEEPSESAPQQVTPSPIARVPPWGNDEVVEVRHGSVRSVTTVNTHAYLMKLRAKPFPKHVPTPQDKPRRTKRKRPAKEASQSPPGKAKKTKKKDRRG